MKHLKVRVFESFGHSVSDLENQEIKDLLLSKNIGYLNFGKEKNAEIPLEEIYVEKGSGYSFSNKLHDIIHQKHGFSCNTYELQYEEIPLIGYCETVINSFEEFEKWFDSLV